jgi:hypothetical protein
MISSWTSYSFDTTILHNNAILYDNLYHNIYMYIGIQVTKCITIGLQPLMVIATTNGTQLGLLG